MKRIRSEISNIAATLKAEHKPASLQIVWCGRKDRRVDRTGGSRRMSPGCSVRCENFRAVVLDGVGVVCMDVSVGLRVFGDMSRGRKTECRRGARKPGKATGGWRTYIGLIFGD